LTFPPGFEIIDCKPPTPPRRQVPTYKIQREYTNWEEITVEADSKEHAEELAEDDDTWDNAYDVNSYNYTGETWVGEADE
jgi:hypothetical protein